MQKTEQINELQKLAWNDFRQAEGRIVFVRAITGYAANNSVDVSFGDQPIRVRVRPKIMSCDIERWNDEHLDPTWPVDIVDQDVPEIRDMSSFWVHATSRSLSGSVEDGDVVRFETRMERLIRLIRGPRMCNQKRKSS